MDKPLEKRLPEFDPSSPPNSPQNQEAAEARDLTFNYRERRYTDYEGEIVRDEFGQPL